MSSETRRSRPKLERSEPIRRFTGVFGPPTNGRTDSGDPTSARPPSPADPVSAGVDLGYRVIDEYMRQGQEFAKRFWPGVPSSAPSAADPQRLAERMYQYATDLASVWLEYTQMTTGAMPFATPRSPTPNAAPVGGFDIGGTRAASTSPAAHAHDSRNGAVGGPGEPPLISIDILSTVRAEVTVDLRPSVVSSTLSVHDLRAGDPGLPRIGGTTIEVDPADHRVLVRIRLPDGQPPGTYSGLIVDTRTNLPKGTLSVRVLE
jgi:hypothetical protein